MYYQKVSVLIKLSLRFHYSILFFSISSTADNKHSKIIFISFHAIIIFMVFCHKIIITNTIITNISSISVPHIKALSYPSFIFQSLFQCCFQNEMGQHVSMPSLFFIQGFLIPFHRKHKHYYLSTLLPQAVFH